MKSIHVGLVADPAAPSEMARRIKDLDPPAGEERDAWDFEVVTEPFTTGCEDAHIAWIGWGTGLASTHGTSSSASPSCLSATTTVAIC